MSNIEMFFYVTLLGKFCTSIVMVLTIVLTMVFTFRSKINIFLFKLTPLCNTDEHNIPQELIYDLLNVLLPTLIIALLSTPSYTTLNLNSQLKRTALTIKLVAHQWYWELVKNNQPSKECTILPYYKTWGNGTYLLESTNNLQIPLAIPVKFIITSADVIHSFNIPTAAVKLDAIPGRLNQVSTSMNKPGVLFTQCVELCGANHSYMPIQIIVS